MSLSAIATVELVSSMLKVGMEGYEMAKRLTAEGYDVPGLEEFEQETAVLRALPDLTPDKDGGTPAPAQVGE